MQSDYSVSSPKGDYTWNHYAENSSVYRGLSSAERIGAERGYAQGVEDERRRNREKITKIILRLKLRGYPVEHIAEDTGFPVDDVAGI